MKGPANLLNNAPKKPSYWIILDICVADNFISVYILLSNAFVILVVCLVVNNNSWGKLFPLKI